MALSLLLIAVAIKAIQEYRNETEYSYFSLWSYKTREKVFEKDGKSVHLIGMIHIASKEYYLDVTSGRNMAIWNPDTGHKENKIVTLMEGIKYEKEKKRRDISSLNYIGISQALGLERQGKYSNKFPNIHSADIDFADFSEETKDEIAKISSIMDKLSSFLMKKISFQEFADFMTENKVDKFLVEDSPVKHEMIFKRNDYLWNEFEKKESSYDTILVPWGAAHLPDIEQRLIEKGYVLKEKREYKSYNVIKVAFNVIKSLIGHLLS